MATSNHGDYRTTGHLFSVSKMAVCPIIRGVLHHSGGGATKVPTGDFLKEVIHSFEHKWGVPPSASMVDGTHIPIIYVT